MLPTLTEQRFCGIFTTKSISFILNGKDNSKPQPWSHAAPGREAKNCAFQPRLVISEGFKSALLGRGGSVVALLERSTAGDFYLIAGDFISERDIHHLRRRDKPHVFDMQRRSLFLSSSVGTKKQSAHSVLPLGLKGQFAPNLKFHPFAAHYNVDGDS